MTLPSKPYPPQWEQLADLRVFRTTTHEWEKLIGWRPGLPTSTRPGRVHTGARRTPSRGTGCGAGPADGPTGGPTLRRDPLRAERAALCGPSPAAHPAGTGGAATGPGPGRAHLRYRDHRGACRLGRLPGDVHRGLDRPRFRDAAPSGRERE